MGSLNQELKRLMKDITFLLSDLLHVYGGVLFFLGWRLIFRSQKQYLALLIILLIAILNEGLDISFTIQKSHTIDLIESIKDTANTIFLPIILHFFFKYTKTKDVENKSF